MTKSIRLQIFLATVALMLFFSGCAATPSGMMPKGTFENLFTQEDVPDPISENLQPGRVAVLPFENLTGHYLADGIVRKSFYNHFSSKRYRDVELHEIDTLLAQQGLSSPEKVREAPPAEIGELLGADGLIYGRIHVFRRIFLGVYSQVSVELESWFIHAPSGTRVWECTESSTRHEFGEFLDPIRVIPTLIRTVLNMRNIEFQRTTDDLCRKIVARFPEPAVRIADPELVPPKPEKKAHIAEDSFSEALNRAEGLMNSGAYGAAEKALLEASRRRPDDSGLQFLLAVCYYHLGDVDNAVSRLETAAALDPENAGLHYHLGLLYVETGRKPEALAAWRKAVARDPGHASAHALLDVYRASTDTSINLSQEDSDNKK